MNEKERDIRNYISSAIESLNAIDHCLHMLQLSINKNRDKLTLQRIKLNRFWEELEKK